MPPKLFLFGNRGRARLLAGTRVLARAVQATLGPGGRTVFIERPLMGSPLITKDGVTVAEEIELGDWFANLGAQLAFESAARTGTVAGDGTTTATILAHAIFEEAAKLVAAGHHPMDLKRGIERGVEHVVAALAKLSKPVRGKRDIAKIATISSNGDAWVGKMIAEAVGEVGPEGIIHVEQGQELETKLEVAEGTEIERGFLSMYFITDKERLVVRLEDPYLLLCEGKITRVEELVPILEKVKKTGRSLLVVGDVQGDALSLLVVNKLQGTMNVCAILPPYYMKTRAAAIADLAAQTGGRVVSDGPGVTLSSVMLEDLGRAKRVVVDQEKTTIIGGAGRKAEIEARAREIRGIYEQTGSTFQKQQLDERLRRLVGGAAVIRVGGTTLPEVRERKARIEDALFATRAAVAEGIVVGGGVALLRAAQGLSRLEAKLPAVEAPGVAIVRRACEIPCRQIVENAGDDGSIVLGRVRGKNGSFGYNAATGELEDLIRAGVIDPTMVVRLALQNAASIAILLLTSEALIVEAPREPVDFPEHGSAADALSLEPWLSRKRPA